MDCLGALVLSLCITWENHRRMSPTILNCGLTALYCNENSCPCLYMLQRLSRVFDPREVIIFSCALTPQHSVRKLYQVHRLFPHVAECFRAYCSQPESQCGTEKRNAHSSQNPCIMHRLIYSIHTHTDYIKSCVFPPLWYLEHSINMSLLDLFERF